MARPKGSINRRTLHVDDIAARFKKSPFEVLMWVAMGDWEALGFKEKTKTTFTQNGIEIEEENVPLKDRVQAATQACKYLYSQKQAVEVSTGENGIKIIVEEYVPKRD